MLQLSYPGFILIPQYSDRTIMEEWANWPEKTLEEPFKGLGVHGSYHMAVNASMSGAAVLVLIDSIIYDYPIDKKRIYITGISIGGFGTWKFTSRRPGLFAAAIPMA